MRVLILENERLIALQMAMMLRAAGGLRVETVATVADARLAVAAQVPHLAFVDVHLGASPPSGAEFARELLACPAIGVIFVTANARKLEPALRDVAGLIEKPFTARTMGGAIAALTAETPPAVFAGMTAPPLFVSRWIDVRRRIAAEATNG